MKFNSQICTSRSQSERLLAMGLRKETADMCMDTIMGYIYTQPCNYIEAAHPNWHLTPLWSLHRLIKIYDKTCIFWTDCLDNPYEAMIGRIANKIKWGELNKEYLE